MKKVAVSGNCKTKKKEGVKVLAGEVKSVFDESFKAYGQVLTGYDYTELFSALSEVEIPEEGVEYVASVETLEVCSVFEEFQERGFGDMPVQVGYCCGRNDMLNSLEYHKSSEFNIAGDDVVLMLGMQQEIVDGKYDTSNVKAFLVPAGTGVELYATTLHYAPCDYKPGAGYRVVCVLPKGTNVGKPKLKANDTVEDRMCFGTNKWLITHPDSDDAKKGAYVGITGENLKLHV